MGTYPAVLNALNLASFPRQILHVVPDLDTLRQPPVDRLLVPLAESPHLVSHIKYLATAHSNSRDVDLEYAKQFKEQNEDSCPFYDYESDNPLLPSLAAKLSELDKITLHGCDYVPRLRLCQECDDTWVSLFAKTTYAHLTHLELVNSYVSGSRLRGFIKRYSGTLQHVKLDFVFLTDSNWRSIAKGLQKCPNLNYLDVGPDTTTGCYIGSLRQKHAAPPLAISLPKKYVTSGFEISKLQSKDEHIDVILRNAKDVAHWLDVFVRYFATDRSIVGDGYGAVHGYKLPVYHEARTFLLPNHPAETPDARSRATIALDKYLEADEGA